MQYNESALLSIMVDNPSNNFVYISYTHEDPEKGQVRITTDSKNAYAPPVLGKASTCFCGEGTQAQCNKVNSTAVKLPFFIDSDHARDYETLAADVYFSTSPGYAKDPFLSLPSGKRFSIKGSETKTGESTFVDHIVLSPPYDNSICGPGYALVGISVCLMVLGIVLLVVRGTALRAGSSKDKSVLLVIGIVSIVAGLGCLAGWFAKKSR